MRSSNKLIEIIIFLSRPRGILARFGQEIRHALTLSYMRKGQKIAIKGKLDGSLLRRLSNFVSDLKLISVPLSLEVGAQSRK
jgi:hypothetical protein